MDDNLNHGLPTDRLKVEWWITSSHVEERLSIETASAKNPFDWGVSEDNFPVLLNTEWDGSGGPVLVPIPANFQAIKNQNIELAMDWRFKTRGIFQALFSKGYAMAGFTKGTEGQVHYYVLVQRNELLLN
jgi:predicted GNAT superfamily acetyltransferase